MRNFFLIFIFLLSPFSLTFANAEKCIIDSSPGSNQSAVKFLKDCALGTQSVSPDSMGSSVEWIKKLVIKISEQVIAFGALFAVGAVVFSGIQYTTSYGDDEKIKKAKNTGVYALIGLILLLVAFPSVDIVINFIYSLAS